MLGALGSLVFLLAWSTSVHAEGPAAASKDGQAQGSKTEAGRGGHGIAAECIALHEEGQEHRLAGRLLSAQERFLRCSESSCPSLIGNDCVRWAAEVEAMTPSISLAVMRDGKAEAPSSLQLDGQFVNIPRPGAQLPLDPGLHQLLITMPDGQQWSGQVAVYEGQVGVPVQAQLPPLKPPEPVADPPVSKVTSAERPLPPPVPASSPRAPHLLGWTLAFGSLGLTGVGAVLGVLALDERAKATAACAPLCSDETRARVARLALASDLVLGAALLGATAATLTFVLEVPDATPQVNASLSGTGAAIWGTF